MRRNLCWVHCGVCGGDGCKAESVDAPLALHPVYGMGPEPCECCGGAGGWRRIAPLIEWLLIRFGLLVAFLVALLCGLGGC